MSKSSEAIRDDPFIHDFYDRISSAIDLSFSDQQLSAIKTAFGDRHWGQHAVDLRVPLRGGKSYFVLLMGREKRGADRLAFDRALRPAATLGSTLFVAFIGLIVLGLVGGGVYAVKSTHNIDIFRGIDVLPDESIKQLVE